MLVQIGILKKVISKRARSVDALYATNAQTSEREHGKQYSQLGLLEGLRKGGTFSVQGLNVVSKGIYLWTVLNLA